MTHDAHDEATPEATTTLPLGLMAATVAMAVVFLVAPIRDSLILAGAVVLVGAVAAVIIPSWVRPPQP